MEKNQNDVGGEYSVQNVEEIENLMDEDDSSALEVITFSRRFPKRIETQLQNDWPMVKSTLKDYGIACELNLVKFSMTFSTTRTRDPDLIDKARDLLRLFSLAVNSAHNNTEWKALGHHQVGVSKRWALLKIWNQEDLKLFNTSAMLDLLLEALALCSCDAKPFHFWSTLIHVEHFLERRKLLLHPSLREIGDVFLCDIFMDGDILVALGPIYSVKVIRVTIEQCMVHKIPPASRVKFVKEVKMQDEARKRLEALIL